MRWQLYQAEAAYEAYLYTGGLDPILIRPPQHALDLVFASPFRRRDFGPMRQFCAAILPWNPCQEGTVGDQVGHHPDVRVDVG